MSDPIGTGWEPMIAQPIAPPDSAKPLELSSSTLWAECATTGATGKTVQAVESNARRTLSLLPAKR